MKNHICLPLVLSFFLVNPYWFSEAKGQSPDNDPDWSVLMQNPDISPSEVHEQFRNAWENRQVTPGCGWKPFKRWEWLSANRLNENGQLADGPSLARLWEDMHAITDNRSLAGNWQQLGPILDGITTRDDIPGVGRMNFIAFHPADPSILYAAAPAGGLWRSYDGGASWESNTDDFPTLGVSSIVVAPANPDVVYIGTGDRDAGDAPGMGVMKSYDGGISWEFVNTGMENKTVGDLLVHPGDENIVIAATNTGIFRTLNGGSSWTQVSFNTNNYKDLDFKPGDPSVVYATGQGRFYRSIDGGATWEYINEGINQGSRMVIAVTPANPEFVYVLATTTYEFKAFYRSTDSGANFTEMSDEPNIMAWDAEGNGSGGQAWYDLCIAADPVNPHVVYVGGVRMKKSVDGGTTWLDINNEFLHVDHHHCAFSPHNDDLYLANDGGVYHYLNNEEWLDISNKIVTGQIYKLGQSMHTPYKLLSGYQDNGTMEFMGAQWLRRGGGDGFECFYDPTDEAWRYGSIYYGNVYRTSPDFENQHICGYDVLGIDEDGAWVTPFMLATHDENTMFVGLKNIWRSFNIKHPERDSIVWERISNNLAGNNNSNMTALEHVEANPNILYCSEGSRKFFRTLNALSPAEEVVWEDFSNNLPWFNTPVLDIETHPVYDSIVWISFNNNIYRSDDRGENWTDITPSFPDITINSVVYDHFSDGGLYIGTDMGIYYTDNVLGEWISFNQGFPLSARVTELDIYYGNGIADSRLRAATYGRGIWESDLYDSETHHFPSVASLSTSNAIYEFFEPMSVNLVFYKNLAGVPVNGLSIDDIWVENAEITSIEGGPVVYQLELQPFDFGRIRLHVEDSVVTDEFGLFNFASDTLSMVYSPVPAPLGWEGPGGVGSLSDLSLWLRPEKEVYQNLQLDPSEADGEPIGVWRDSRGENLQAWLQLDGLRPELALADSGISQKPAVYFRDTLTYLLATDIPVSRDIAVFGVYEVKGPQFNEHGWFASARENNGFLLHPWKESTNFSGHVYNAENQETTAGIMYAGVLGLPHVYGLMFHDNGVEQHVASTSDGETEWRKRTVFRNEEDLINIRFGRDFDDRWGVGKMGEFFMYRERLFESHHIIAHNYLGNKYLIDQGSLDKFHLDSLYSHDLAGIGRESFYDYHLDAQGTGPMRINAGGEFANGEYFMISSDGEALEWIPELYPILSPRLARTWGYECTGSPGTVQMRFYDSEGILDGVSNPGLIISQEPQFVPADNLSFVPLVSVEPGLWSASYEFSGEGCFTIGSEPAVGIQESIVTEQIQVYPNPGLDYVTVFSPGGDIAQLELFDVNGRLFLSSQVFAPEMRIDVRSYASGIYLLRATFSNGSRENTQLKID